jgi:hypothetical protein
MLSADLRSRDDPAAAPGTLRLTSPTSDPGTDTSRPSSSRRQRRKLDTHDPYPSSHPSPASPDRLPSDETPLDSPIDSSNTESEDAIADAVGQLSLNEDEQVRYHGKASGLHLLGDKERLDARNEGGIWSVITYHTHTPHTPYTFLSQAFSKGTRLAPGSFRHTPWDRVLHRRRLVRLTIT